MMECDEKEREESDDRCGSLCANLPHRPVVEHLFDSGWYCLARPRRCGLAGGSISLEVGSEVSKPRFTPSLLSLLCACGLR